MELTGPQLKALKEKELELLQAFIAACRQLDLQYYILEGTLLGAVRHQGFIPWDDDIDVGMPRKDYELFLLHGQELLPKGFFLQSFHTDPEFCENFAKLRNSNTTFVEATRKNCRINHGIYLDIFPLDRCSGKPGFSFLLQKRLAELRISDTYTPQKLKLTSRLARSFSRILYPFPAEAVRKREQLFRSCSQGKYLANHCSPWGNREIVPAHWYGPGIPLLFEGIEVNAPSHYHQWLARVYGDYLQLPPPEQQIPHHYVDDFDLNKAYSDSRNK